MINRILIRIKVVQILYSYLLSRSEFKIDTAPENPSRDRRFAYAVYLDMLMMIQELSAVRVNCPDRAIRAVDSHLKLRTNRVGRALGDDANLKEITFKNSADLNIIGPHMQRIADNIAASTAFKDYEKKKTRTLDDDVKLWITMLETVVLRDAELIKALHANPDFSLVGFNKGIQAAVGTLNAYNDSRWAYQKAKNELDESLNEAYDLYMALFVLIVELTQEQADRQEAAKGKYLATSDDLNPDTRLVDNAFARMLSENETLAKFVKDQHFTWLDSPALLKNLLDSILASETYAEYLAAPEANWKTDCEFWYSVIKNIVIPSDIMSDALEAKSIFWNDDLPTMGTFTLKTIRRFALAENPAEVTFLPQFKDEEDSQFALKLFTFAVQNREQYREYIDKFISRDWDPERLAFMDIVIMLVAIAEILNFPAIPLPVSLNEYIEIANAYSTRRSGPFINGILYSVVKMLVDEGKLQKPFGNLPQDK